MKQAHFEFTKNLQPRHRTGRIWLFIFRASTVVGILALIALLFNVIDGAFGYAAISEPQAWKLPWRMSPA